jgi:aminopeptidase N
MRTEQARPIRLENYRPPDWLVETVELEVSLHPTATKVRATLRMSPNPEAGAAAPIILDGDGLTLTSLKLDGSALPADSYVATPDSLTIPQPPAGTCYLQIDTLIDPSANTQLMGLYRSNATYCTQCEAEGFRRITYFPDRPDVMAVYTTRIEAEKSEAPILLSNGNLIESGPLDGTSRHFAVWHDPFPKPAYLFALVGGDLACVEDKFVTVSGREVALRIYVEHGKQDRCAWAMDSLKRSMRWDEEAFGREYDLDIFMIVAVSDFNMGAMENKGLNIFNDKLVLATPETATDNDYASIEAVIAHEYFHNWTGNRITCRDWFQLCLKEGLTVFRDQEFSSDQRSRPVKRIADVRALRAHQFVEDAGPLAHPVRPSFYNEISNFYTATIYEKGAEVVRMLKVLLGPGGFRKGLDLYFKRHDGEAATVDQFVQCFADANNTDLAQFMRWYAQSGTPQVTATGRYDEGAQTYRLELQQTVPPTPGQPVKEPMVIPLALGLMGRGGRDMSLSLDGGRPVVRGVVTLTQAAQGFEFTGVHERPVLSINRGFSAPVKLTSKVSTEDLQFLAAHDSDLFNRWQAIQSLANTLLIENVTAIRAGREPREDPGLTAALAAVMAESGLEPAFVALALAMPSENDIAREIGENIDPNAIFLSRAWLRAALSSRLAPALRETYRRLDDGSPFRPDAASAGRRALKNACLDLLAATAAASAIALAARQYHQATNMTDRMAALTTLSLYPVPERQAALDDFYRRYSDNPLVIDKWFSLQATIPDPATLDRVKVLMVHPAFSIANPNRVRALIGSFVQMNPTQFNRADGAGFDFLADTALALDSKNPQIAAGITTAFRSWRALEPTRRARAEGALQRVAGAPNLSRDLRDIVDRSLAVS